jgi:uncharacterized membrane protein YedE/YeeE
MRPDERKIRGVVLPAVLFLAAVSVLAAYTGLWALTAIPIGFLFGFFLEKGDLCGASAFSEVLVMKEWQKTWGLWVAIVTAMVGFALLDLLGWVQLSPKPFLWANYLVGGILFGVGMVLTGGCISGTLYKAGVGHINSIAALLGIPIGIALVEYGPLSSWNKQLSALKVTANGGGPVTFSSLTGLPFWTFALALALATLVVATRKRPAPNPAIARDNRPFSLTRKLVARSWRPWQAGLLIGLLNTAAFLSSAASGRNYPLGVTHGVLQAQMVVTDQNLAVVYAPAKVFVNGPAASEPASANPAKRTSLWLILIVVSLVAGSWFSGRLSGTARLIAKPPEQIFASLIGSLLVGAGAALATGCIIGNTMSGIALGSVGMVFFTVVVVLSNWAATYLYFMGGDASLLRR